MVKYRDHHVERRATMMHILFDRGNLLFLKHTTTSESYLFQFFELLYHPKTCRIMSALNFIRKDWWIGGTKSNQWLSEFHQISSRVCCIIGLFLFHAFECVCGVCVARVWMNNPLVSLQNHLVISQPEQAKQIFKFGKTKQKDGIGVNRLIDWFYSCCCSCDAKTTLSTNGHV